METREIGSVKEIDIEQLRIVYHRSGNPAAEAQMLAELLSRGLKQKDIAQLLGVNQAQVSRKLKLLELTEALFARVLAGEIKARTGYQLARLPKEKQAEFEGVKKVTMKVSEEAVREMVLNKDVISLIKDFEEEDVPNRSRGMAGFVKEVYLNGTVRQALERTFSGEESDAILDLLRKGLSKELK